MIKYDGYYISFQEVPDEVSLVLNITNCQGTCDGCHSPWLRGDYGRPLLDDLEELLEKYKNMITCVCFLGEGNDPHRLFECVRLVEAHNLLTCIYSGSDKNRWSFYQTDYFKFGSYKKQLGGLKSPTTNQRMFHYSKMPGCKPPVPTDITYRFRNNYRKGDFPCES